MAKVKQQTGEELAHVDESATVRAVDEKLRPLKERRAALELKAHRWRGLLDPHVNVERTEREYIEAKIGLPQAEIELNGLALEIADLTKERVRVCAVEKDRKTSDLQRRRIALAQRLASVLLDQAAPLNQELYDCEESFGRLGLDPIGDHMAWPELMAPTPTWTPRLHDFLQALSRLNGQAG